MGALSTVAARILDSSGRVLLVRRSPSDTYSGIWEMPGGSIDQSESPVQAVVREVYEETGLVLTLLSPEPFDMITYTDLEQSVPSQKYCFDMSFTGTSEVILSIDHDSYRWFTIEDIRALCPHTSSQPPGSETIWSQHHQCLRAY